MSVATRATVTRASRPLERLKDLGRHWHPTAGETPALREGETGGGEVERIGSRGKVSRLW